MESTPGEPSDGEGGIIDPMQALATIRELISSNRLPTLEPLLPLMLNLKGAPYTLEGQFHFASLFRTRRPQRVVYQCGRQVGKCVVLSDTPRIQLADGRLVGTAAVRVGDAVVTTTDSFETTVSRVSKIFRTGEQECFRVRTRMGAELELTAEHRIRTLTGYVAVRDLVPGSRVCGVRRAGQFADGAQPAARVVLTALLLGDGACGTSGNFSVTSATDAVIDACRAWPDVTGPTRLTTSDGCARAVHFSHDRCYQLRQWVDADAMWGKYAWEKTIPAWVFQLSRAQTRQFISALFAADGSIKPPQTIDYCSTSRTLARQVRSLLHKFGIPASIRRKPAGYKTKDGTRKICRDAWIVRVETRDGLRTFFANFDVPGKPAFALPNTAENNNRDTVPIEVQGILDELAGGVRHRRGRSFRAAGLRQKLKYPPQRRKLQHYCDVFAATYPAPPPALAKLRAACSTDVIWDEVKSVEAIGTRETCDFEIDTTHNFVDDGIVTHNSTTFSADGVMLAAMIPHFTTLYVTPLFEQIRRFSTLSVRPFIQESPVRELWQGTNTENSVLQRTFVNGSRMMFSFASTDADRVRGLSVNKCAIDEAQDVDKDLLPIILETMAADRKYALEQYSGTPKTTDGPLAWLWKRSSQAEWWIPCTHCTTNGHPTWNIPSLDHHLEQMLGPLHYDISPECPAIICHKCRKPIYSRLGHWEHRFPDRRWEFAGYHIPQPIIPLHYDNPKKWAALLGKRERASPAVFANEVLGESADVGQRLITSAELQNACTLPWRNKPDNPDPALMSRLGQYRTRVLAVDWGGGGEAGLSFTVITLLGFSADGTIEVAWAKQLYGTDHIAEAAEVVRWFEYFGCDMLTHDYTGAGTLRETLLIRAGLPMSRDMPIQYVRSASQDLLVPVPTTDTHRRAHWRVDKTRSLHYTIAMIRLGRMRFFQEPPASDDAPSLVEQFLRLIEHRTDIEIGGNYYTIKSNMTGPDDFAQAVNIGAVCTWEINGAYPDLAEAAGIRLSPEAARAGGGIDFGWEHLGGEAHPFDWGA